MTVKSTTTLFTGNDVCDAAGIPRSTLQYWIQVGFVPPPMYELGENRKTPVFTRAEVKHIQEVAKERKAALNIIRPSRDSK